MCANLRSTTLFIFVGLLSVELSICGGEKFQVTLCTNETVSVGDLLDGRMDSPEPYTVMDNTCSMTFVDLPQPYFWLGGTIHKVIHQSLTCDYSLSLEGFSICAGLIPNGIKAAFARGGGSITLSAVSQRDWRHTFYVQVMVARPMCHGISYTVPVELGSVGRLVSHSKFNFGYNIPTVTGDYSDGERCPIRLDGFVVGKELLLIKFIYFEVEAMVLGNYCADYLSIYGITSGQPRICGKKRANTLMLFEPTQQVVMLIFVSNPRVFISSSTEPGFMLEYSVITLPEYDNATVSIINQAQLQVKCNQGYHINGTESRNRFLAWNGEEWAPLVYCIEYPVTTTSPSTTTALASTSSTNISTTTKLTSPSSTTTSTRTSTAASSTTTSTRTSTAASPTSTIALTASMIAASPGETLPQRSPKMDYYIYGALVGAFVLCILIATIVGVCYQKSAEKEDKTSEFKRRPFNHIGKYVMAGFS